MTKFLTYLLSFLVILASSCNGGQVPHAGPVRSSSIGHIGQNEKTTRHVKCDLVELEIPSLIAEDIIVKHIGYTLSYNHITLCPNWVAYELTSDEVQGKIKGKESFRWDPDVSGRQPNREDYKNDMQWDKGHMAPKADMKWSLQAYEESFYLTNICPQNHAFNAGIWCSTEKIARRAATKFGRVYVVCGPLFENDSYGSLGTSQITIPDKFFKALLVPKTNTYSAIAFVLNNSPNNSTIKESSITVDSLEIIIGRDLFYNLDDSVEGVVESKIIYVDWF